MGVENEITGFLESNIKDSANKTRDMDIIRFYYGLSESPWPTYAETASHFGVGTKQRIEQLIKSKFKDIVNKGSIPSLKTFINILESRDYWLLSEFEEEIYSAGLMNRQSHLKGIFNLINDISIDCKFEFYTPELKRATRSSIATSKSIFLIRVSNIKNVEKLFSKAQALPGRCGIANLNYIRDELGQDYKLISLLIENSHTSWVRAVGGDYWYIFENRDNTIINYCEKVFCVIDTCDSERLSITFRNALDKRTNKYPYPPTEIIEEYLKSSVYIVNTERGLKFIGETTKLNEIEEDLISFLGTDEIKCFPELYEYLSRKGYGRPYILKTTNNSPLVYVDKTKGVKHYTYSLISHPKSVQNGNSDINTYEVYLRRLRALLDVGTDESREDIARKEQHILQDWLFKDKTHENCAICGQEFSVKTLVTAHKKPRSDCNDAERLDPYIVMPVCLMGCDYLYENIYVYIEDSEIKRGVPFLDARDEASFIERLVGKKVDSKWLLGSQSYFRSPNKALQRTSR